MDGLQRPGQQGGIRGQRGQGRPLGDGVGVQNVGPGAHHDEARRLGLEDRGLQPHVDGGDLRCPAGLPAEHLRHLYRQGIGGAPRPAGVAGGSGGEAQRLCQGLVPGGQSGLLLPPDAPEEGGGFHRPLLRPHPAQVGRRGGYAGELLLPGHHPVGQPGQEGQGVPGAGGVPDPGWGGDGLQGEGEAGVGVPVGPLQRPAQAPRRAAEGPPLLGHQPRPAGRGDGVVGGAPLQLRLGEGEVQRGQEPGQGLDGVAPAPVDVVPRVAPGAAGEGEGIPLPRRGGGKGQGPGEGLPPPPGGGDHHPPQVEAVGVDEVLCPGKPRRVHPFGPLQPHLLGHGEEQAQRPVGHPLPQEPEHSGVAQIVVRPQGGAAVRAEEALPLRHRHAVPRQVVARAGGGGAHHIQVALEDHQGRPLPARGWGHIGGQVVEFVLPHRQAQSRQMPGQGAADRLFVPGGVGRAVQEGEHLHNAPDDGPFPAQPLDPIHAGHAPLRVWRHCIR